MASLRRTHGATKTAEYRIWAGIIKRCTNPNAHAWDRYGGRGIAVCERWRFSFTAFLDDMGPRPSPGHSIDRIDNDGHYEPGNCRWATHSEQRSNTSLARRISFNDVTLLASEWDVHLGHKRGTVARRIASGWPVDLALTKVGRFVRPQHMREAA